MSEVSTARPGRRPKVAMIGSRGFPGQHGGVERVLEAVCPRLVATGRADVVVHCAHWLDLEGNEYRGVELRRARGLRSKYGDTFTRSLVATFRELFSSTDVVHYHSIGSAPLALLPRLFRKKVVVTVHGLDWQRSKWNSLGKWFLQFGEWASVRFPHRTLVVGRELQEYLEQRYGRRIDFIANGAEHREPRPAELILEEGIVPRKFVLFVGRIVPEKGVHVLVEAFRSIDGVDDVQLVLVGSTWYESEYHDQLKRLVGDDGRIRFMGEVSDEVLHELYSNCAVYVLPSEVEGMSLSLLDAMAFGCCIVTSSIPPNANLVGDAGLVFRTGNVEDLAQQLGGVLRDDEAAEKHRTMARARAEGEFNWDRIADEWADVYDDLLAADG
jgi:glycosyltransferase involved in cell wall biosynthesis